MSITSRPSKRSAVFCNAVMLQRGQIVNCLAVVHLKKQNKKQVSHEVSSRTKFIRKRFVISKAMLKGVSTSIKARTAVRLRLESTH